MRWIAGWIVLVGSPFAFSAELVVRGHSMNPIFKDGQTVQFMPGYYQNHPIRRGDIVVAKIDGRTHSVLKKIHAIPGDSFRLIGSGGGSCQIEVNGQVLANSKKQKYKLSAGHCRMLALYEKDYHQKIPAHSYLLLGEAIHGTLDSGRFGLIDQEQIEGRVVEPSASIPRE